MRRIGIHMQTFYVAPIGINVGLTSVSLGLVLALTRVGLKVGFIKPIAQMAPTEKDVEHSTHFAQQIFHLSSPTPISFERMEALLGAGQHDLLMEEVVSLYEKSVSDDLDVMIIEGLVTVAQHSYIGSLNAEIARNLEADTIFVLSGQVQTPKDIIDQLDITVHQFLSVKNPKFAGLILNKTPNTGEIDLFNQEIYSLFQGKRKNKIPLLGCIPFNKSLTAPRLIDVANHLNAHIDFSGHLNDARVQDIVVGARAIANLVERLRPGALVISAGDRDEVMLATALAYLRGIPLAGLLLTCDSMPHPNIQQLCLAAMQKGLGVLSTPYDTFEAVHQLTHMSNQVPIDDVERMENVVNAVAEHIDVEILKNRIGEPSEKRMPPPAFRYQLIQKARLAQKRIILPEGTEPRTIKAAVICAEKNIARCILLGKEVLIKEVAEAQGIDLTDKVDIIDPESVRAHYVLPMVELRKNKGLTAPMAEAQLEDNVVLATMMLALDEVDGLVSGALHTTANTIRPALQLIKANPDAKIVSSIFFMLLPEQVLVYGDCAVNPDPSAEELASIAIQSADSAKAFGLSPRIAMISYSTGTSGTGTDVDKVREATKIAQTRRPDLILDGPLQYDAASVESVGRQKAPDSPVAGRANVFIFPDLNTGNTTYKAVQRSADVVSIGPMLQGLRKPVNDLSRGALVDDIVYTIALTAIQAQKLS